MDVVGHPDGATTVVARTTPGILLATTRAVGESDFPTFEPISGFSASTGEVVTAVDGHGAVTVVWFATTATGVEPTSSTRQPETKTWSQPNPSRPRSPTPFN